MNLLYQFNPEDILFLDIETVPGQSSLEELSPRLQKLWLTKADNTRKKTDSPTGETPDESYHRAGIYAEFGKIVCISAGVLRKHPDGYSLRLKSFFGDNEKSLIEDFFSLLKKHFNQKESTLCAHNGKEFDFPYIARRAIINGLMLPPILDLAGKKPWETQLLDTMELWKFGDYKSYTSLELLAAIFDIDTPKDDINGSMVREVYYKEKDVERIAKYCMKDVLTIVQLFLRFRGEPLLEERDVINT